MQVTADLTILNAKKVGVKFDYFKLGGLVSHLEREYDIFRYVIVLIMLQITLSCTVPLY